MSDEKLIDEIAGTIWHKRTNCLANCKPIAKEIIELVRDSDALNIESIIRERYRQKIFIFFGADGVNKIESAYNNKYPSPPKQE